jgi:hypothetical protein
MEVSRLMEELKAMGAKESTNFGTLARSELSRQ